MDCCVPHAQCCAGTVANCHLQSNNSGSSHSIDLLWERHDPDLVPCSCSAPEVQALNRQRQRRQSQQLRQVQGNFRQRRRAVPQAVQAAAWPQGTEAPQDEPRQRRRQAHRRGCFETLQAQDLCQNEAVGKVQGGAGSQ